MTLTKQLTIMVALSVLLGLGARVVQKHPVPFWGFPQPLALVQPRVAYAGADQVTAEEAFPPSDQVYEVDLSTVMGLYMKRKKSNVHFVDAREPKLYAAGHIPGAVNIPFERLADYETALAALPQPDLVVLYCDGGDCHLSHDLSEVMQERGYKRLAVFTGGWAEWSTETDQIETATTAGE